MGNSCVINGNYMLKSKHVEHDKGYRHTDKEKPRNADGGARGIVVG